MTIQTNINQELQQKLWDAAAKGDSASLRLMAFEKAVDFRGRDDQKRTPFNLATQYGHHDAAMTILAIIRMQFEQSLSIDRVADDEVAATPRPRTWLSLLRLKNA